MAGPHATRRIWPRLAVALLAGHLLFCAVRVPYAAYGQRWQAVREWQQRGAADYHLRLDDEETRRVAGWLVATVPMDAVVLYDGSPQGCHQQLAALLFPRLLVHESAVPSGATTATSAGRPVFRQAPPWDPTATGTPVVVGGLETLRLRWRP